ncbi:MAG: MarC family protein [Acidimicrobiales bacterium]
MSDIVWDWDLLIRTFVTILVIMDPLGNVPIFLSLTKRMDRAQRNRAGRQAIFVATVVILAFAVFGQQLLRVLGISVEALQVSGGLILALVALELLQHAGDDNAPSTASGLNIALVPLGTPLLAGPGAIAATMVYMRQAETFGATLSVIGALFGALAVCWLALRFSGVLARVVKENGIELLSKVVGLLLAAIAVQLVAEGIQEWITNGV